ncbi:chloride channel protein [Agrilactobacillus yilanensis]|uniref:Chloride channel protein n=1 Tax=Agrilactobacillus yilanensis TaxID=2485997 RepID=A0ABW4J3D6_9LACO|nr:chloride channel protein [Agrilactobacillus yilanensis]
MKFNSVFIAYSVIMGFIVGLFSALFLAIINFLIHGIWEILPAYLNAPSYYPLIIGIIGGLGVGWFQRFMGPYPRTMQETLMTYKTTKSVPYRHQLSKNFFAALLVLSFGASLGPEAALSSLLGGLISWVGDRMKLTLAKKQALLELSIGAMLSAIFHAPFAGITTPIEQPDPEDTAKSKWPKIILYGLTTLFGFLGFILVNHLVPKETIFEIRMPKIAWDTTVLWFLLPALLLGLLFGYFFLWLEKWSDLLAQKIGKPIILALIAGILLGLLGMVSPYFLFSGEHSILPLSKDYKLYSSLSLCLLALGKTLLTNLSFAFGWRGGKIFPAIFASATLGFAFVRIFPYTPGLIVGIITAAGVTVILKRPLITAALLLFLLPLQFFPIVLLSCFISAKLDKQIRQRLVKNY